jgi:hypothetical protein
MKLTLRNPPKAAESREGSRRDCTNMAEGRVGYIQAAFEAGVEAGAVAELAAAELAAAELAAAELAAVSAALVAASTAA